MKAAYHSPLRQAQAESTRARILEASAALMEAGEDLTYAAVATRAGVQERTVYRHFPAKADLETGLWSWITGRLTHADLSARNEEQLVAAMRESFSGFDAGAPLIQAMLHSRQGLAVRRGQQERRRAMFEACAASAAPGLGPAVRARAAAALQILYSAQAWEQLREFWGLDARAAADVVELGIRSLLAGLTVKEERS